MRTIDELFMAAALALARGVKGRTADNPPVGCVIVKDGRRIAGGATQPPGGAHAEVMAVREAQRREHSVTGSDLYVILEPCAFTGRTPPCSTLIAGLRPARVVVGVQDPHPQVNGRGLAELRAAGIEVVSGVLEDQVREHLCAWLRRFEGNAPLRA